MPRWVRVVGASPASLDALQADRAAALGVEVDDVVVVSTTPPGKALAIWSVELPNTTREEPDVQAQLDRHGMVWAEHYSVLCPTGEAGFFSPLETEAHLVDQAAFDLASVVGWRRCPPGDPAAGFTWLAGCRHCGALDFYPHGQGLACGVCSAIEART
jgi:hypothetical protein